MRDLDRILNDAADAGRHASIPLPAAQIRRVAGRVRQVRAATTTALSAAVVTAVVVLVTSVGVPEAAPDIVDSPGPTQTPTAPTPSQTTPPPTSPPTSAPPLSPILDGRLLTVDDIAAHSSGSVVDEDWAEDDGTSEATCQPADADGAVERGHIRYAFGGSSPTAVDQWAEAFSTLDEAVERVEDLRAFFASCAEEQGDEVDLFNAFTMRGVGDAGFIVVMQQPYTVDTALFVEVRTAATGRVVTWTTYTVEGQDYNGLPSPREIVQAIDHLCDTAGGACVTDPVLDETYPRDVVGLTAGLLLPREVASAFGGGWTQYSESIDFPLYEIGACETVPTEERTAVANSSYGTEIEGRDVSASVSLFDGAQAAAVHAADLAQCLDDDPASTPSDTLDGAWSTPTRGLLVVRVDGSRVVMLSISLGAETPDPAAVTGLVALVERRLADEA